MDVVDEENLCNHGEQNNNEDCEEVRLVVENIDGLLRSANLEEPVELSHCVVFVKRGSFLGGMRFSR